MCDCDGHLLIGRTSEVGRVCICLHNRRSGLPPSFPFLRAALALASVLADPPILPVVRKNSITGSGITGAVTTAAANLFTLPVSRVRCIYAYKNGKPKGVGVTFSSFFFAPGSACVARPPILLEVREVRSQLKAATARVNGRRPRPTAKGFPASIQRPLWCRLAVVRERGTVYNRPKIVCCGMDRPAVYNGGMVPGYSRSWVSGRVNVNNGVLRRCLRRAGRRTLPVFTADVLRLRGQ